MCEKERGFNNLFRPFTASFYCFFLFHLSMFPGCLILVKCWLELICFPYNDGQSKSCSYHYKVYCRQRGLLKTWRHEMTLRTQGTNSFPAFVSISEGIMMGNFACNQKLFTKVLYFNFTRYILSTKTKAYLLNR